jgi:hypothetical protein
MTQKVMFKMKVKISQLKPNPFKKEINGGRLNKAQVDVIKANIKELGLMGSLAVFKKGNDYYLINGHHRTQALKETFGKDYQVEVVVHKYDDEQVMRGMVIENLTQRGNDFREVNENLVMVRNHLRKTAVQSLNTCDKLGRRKGTNQIQEPGSIRHVAEWLNKNGEVLSIGVISNHLKIYDKLDKKLYDRIEKTHKGDADKRTDKNTISFCQAELLARFDDKKEQEDLTEVLLNSKEQRVREQGKLVTEYKKASKDVKDKIRKRKVDLKEVSIENHKATVGEVNLDREKMIVEHHVEIRKKLHTMFEDTSFIKKSPSNELEITYHFIMNWLKEDLMPFLKQINKELSDEAKNRMKDMQENVIYYDFDERRLK